MFPLQCSRASLFRTIHEGPGFITHGAEFKIGDSVVVEIKIQPSLDLRIRRCVNDLRLRRLRQCEHSHSGSGCCDGVHVELLMGRIRKVGCPTWAGMAVHRCSPGMLQFLSDVITIIAPTINLDEDQLLCCVLAAGSSRRQIDSPGAPSANAPRVAGSGVWLLRAAVGSASSGPLVAPAIIALPGMVSKA